MLIMNKAAVAANLAHAECVELLDDTYAKRIKA